MADDLIWEEPEPIANQNTDWDAKMEALKERPGQWAKLREYGSKNGASSKATDLRKKYKGFEFTTRTDKKADPEVVWLYGRMLPVTEAVVV